jgi:hypothetical protein
MVLTKFNPLDYIKKMHRFTLKHIIFLLLFCSVYHSNAQSDELDAVFADLVYDPDKSYSSGSAVVISLEDGEIYTSNQDVPAAADGSNGPNGANASTYWGDSTTTTQTFEQNNPTFLDSLPNDINTTTLSTQVAELTNPSVSTFYGISSRAFVDDAPMVGSVIINGTESKKIMIRAKGPSMNLPGKALLPNPKLVVLQKGDDGWTIIETSFDYGDHESASQYSQFATENVNEPMIVMTLDPGTYSFRVLDEDGQTGNANLEIYEIEGEEGTSVFYGISSRAYIDDAPMVGSIIINGNNSKKVMIRAKGPSMNLPGKKLLPDPKLVVLQKGDEGWSIIDTSFDFGDHQSSSAYPENATENNKEPIIVMTLDPGTYSFRVLDENGEKGNANLEIYEQD